MVIPMPNTPNPARVDGAKIRELRRPYFQTGIAQAMVTRGHTTWRQQTLARVERGSRELSLAEALSLAEVLSCKVEDFLADENLIEARARIFSTEVSR
jgi:hypothetical protein